MRTTLLVNINVRSISINSLCKLHAKLEIERAKPVYWEIWAMYIALLVNINVQSIFMRDLF